MPFLDWVNKNQAKESTREVPYHLLKQETSYGEPGENLLIQGDNLLALKALIPFYAGRVKCIYIDPPYNTLSAFEHYDDRLEHSQWLTMIYPRLVLLRDLLADSGTIWVSVDDNEVHYLKVVMDEVFGRKNFVNQISAKMKLVAGASGGGEDKKLKKNMEYLLVYAKDYDGGFKKFNDVYEEENLFDLIDEMEANEQSWKYTSILVDKGEFVEQRVVLDGAGLPITVKKYKGIKRTTVSELIKKGELRERAYVNNFPVIFSDTNAQTSIRTRIIDEFVSLEKDELLIASYVPRSGRDKNKVVEHYYISPSIRRVIWLKDTAEIRGGKPVKLEKVGTLWQGFSLNNLTKEGDVRFPNGKKPEALIQKILELSTAPGDLVLDSFLGSGTTAAVSKKMGRKFIGIEMGEHARTHCIPRLQKVTEGEQGGVSELVRWKGGGGFRFCTLGEPAFDASGHINPDVRFSTLAAFVWHFETGEPSKKPMKKLLLGTYGEAAYFLLYNGILGDRRPAGGNVLTGAVLQMIKDSFPHKGPKVIYGETTTLGAARLAAEGITFKQIPYDVKMR